MKRIILLFLLVILILAGFLCQKYQFRGYNRVNAENIQDKIDEKINDLSQQLDKLESNLHLKEEFNIREYTSLLDNKDYVLGYYSNGKLEFWTDNRIAIYERLTDSIRSKPLHKLDNHWVYFKEKRLSQGTIAGYFCIKTEYNYQNEYLKNEFFEGSGIPAFMEISNNPDDGISIKDEKGNFLFSLSGTDQSINERTNYLSVIFYIASFILLVILLNRWLRGTTGYWERLTAFGTSVLILTAIAILINYFDVPGIFQKTDLFSPEKFGMSKFLGSPGDLLALSICLLISAAFFHRYLYFPSDYHQRYKKGFNFISGFLILFGAAYFMLILYLQHNLIIHSTISFEYYKIISTSVYSYLGLLIFGFFLLAFILYIDKLSSLFIHKLNQLELHLRILLVSSAVFIPGSFIFIPAYILDLPTLIVSILFYIVLVYFISYYRYKNQNFTYTTTVIYLLIVTVFGIFIINRTNIRKERINRSVIAVNLESGLVSEQDYLAELRLPIIEERIRNDEDFLDILDNFAGYEEDEEAVFNYLKNSVFYGFWSKYDLQAILCWPQSDLILENANARVECYPYFETELIDKYGHRLEDCNFYFLDNRNGRISYFGDLVFNEGTVNEIRLFIELQSRLIYEGLGYPELLQNDSYNSRPVYEGYSYAKYMNGALVTQFGDYSYNFTDIEYSASKDEFAFVTMNGYSHLIYSPTEDSRLIISKEAVTFANLLTSFPYIFIFLYLAIIPIFFVHLYFKGRLKFRLNYKYRIQLSMIFVLFISFLLIGGGTIYYDIQRFKKNQTSNLNEKIQSVLVEMENRLDQEEELSPEMGDYLNYLLEEFSNVFYSDINLYDISGELLATSRQSIFNRGLLSEYMNARAYYQMGVIKRATFIQRETIGELKYLSAYVPLTNSNMKLLAYLNLPYFTRQNEIDKDVTNLIVTIVNIYLVLIFITIFIAIFLSNQISRPLSLIQERMRNLNLIGKNEPIEYSEDDEIKGLIDQYNRMLEELQHSAELLAQSERESAWREMAKQIAHEIKNPLTPMKLNIQHLLRSWNDKNPEFEKQLKNASQTLIDQIDNLSTIASEFSNFAKMPQAKRSAVDLSAKIKSTQSLFQDEHRAEVILGDLPEEPVYIFIDKEQIQRVLTNLVKNAIQAIPEKKPGKVILSLEVKGKNALVKIKDNGSGIPKDLHDKLFRPNFTTKSTGMGLGLAIVHNIILLSDGKIWFETEEGKGSTFFIQFPIFVR